MADVRTYPDLVPRPPDDRGRITLAPGQTASIDMVTGAGQARETCDQLIDKYRDRRLAELPVEAERLAPVGRVHRVRDDRVPQRTMNHRLH